MRGIGEIVGRIHQPKHDLVLPAYTVTTWLGQTAFCWLECWTCRREPIISHRGRSKNEIEARTGGWLCFKHMNALPRGADHSIRTQVAFYTFDLLKGFMALIRNCWPSRASAGVFSSGAYATRAKRLRGARRRPRRRNSLTGNTQSNIRLNVEKLKF